MTILNETIVTQIPDYIKIIVLVIGLISIMSIFLYAAGVDWCSYVIIIGLLIMITVFLAGTFIPSIQEPFATDYQVIFTEDVDINKFCEQYEIIEQNGKIFTIREYYDK